MIDLLKLGRIYALYIVLMHTYHILRSILRLLTSCLLMMLDHSCITVFLITLLHYAHKLILSTEHAKTPYATFISNTKCSIVAYTRLLLAKSDLITFILSGYVFLGVL